MKEDATTLEEAIGPTYPLAAEVSRVLEGAVFPLNRRQLIYVARENEAGKMLLSLLHTLPGDVELKSLDQVEQLLSG